MSLKPKPKAKLVEMGSKGAPTGNPPSRMAEKVQSFFTTLVSVDDAAFNDILSGLSPIVVKAVIHRLNSAYPGKETPPSEPFDLSPQGILKNATEALGAVIIDTLRFVRGIDGVVESGYSANVSVVASSPSLHALHGEGNVQRDATTSILSGTVKFQGDMSTSTADLTDASVTVRIIKDSARLIIDVHNFQVPQEDQE